MLTYLPTRGHSKGEEFRKKRESLIRKMGEEEGRLSLDCTDFPALSGSAPSAVEIRMEEIKENYEDWAKYVSENTLRWCMEFQNVVIGLICIHGNGQRAGYLNSMRLDQLFKDKFGT